MEFITIFVPTVISIAIHDKYFPISCWYARLKRVMGFLLLNIGIMISFTNVFEGSEFVLFPTPLYVTRIFKLMLLNSIIAFFTGCICTLLRYRFVLSLSLGVKESKENTSEETK